MNMVWPGRKDLNERPGSTLEEEVLVVLLCILKLFSLFFFFSHTVKIPLAAT